MDANAISSFAEQLRRIDLDKPGQALETAGALLREAIDAGACSGPDWTLFRKHAHGAEADTAFVAAVQWLANNLRYLSVDPSLCIMPSPARIHGGTVWNPEWVDWNIHAVADLLEREARNPRSPAAAVAISESPTPPAPTDYPLPEADVLRVFNLQRNVLRRFLDRHPEIKPDCTSQKRRKLLPLVALVKAMMQDDRLAGHVKTEKRITQNMARLDLDAKYQRAIQEAILGR